MNMCNWNHFYKSGQSNQRAFTIPCSQIECTYMEERSIEDSNLGYPFQDSVISSRCIHTYNYTFTHIFIWIIFLENKSTNIKSWYCWYDLLFSSWVSSGDTRRVCWRPYIRESDQITLRLSRPSASYYGSRK